MNASEKKPLNQSTHIGNSVTLWLNELKHGSEEAATELWQRYFSKLIALANRKLGPAPRRVTDEEDLALDVFNSLCDGAERGRFERLNDRDDLWKLLVAMTRNKSANQLRSQSALKRGGQKVRGLSIFVDASGDGQGLDVFLGDDPTPEFLVQIQEEQERLMNLLRDENHRQIAQLRLHGYSVNEVAEKMGISSRSIKRKLALIREAWIVELVDNS